MTGCLTGQRFGDVDIFLTGARDDAEEKLRAIFDAVKAAAVRHDPKNRFLVLRSSWAVTIFVLNGCGRIGPPIQVVLSVYESTLAVLQDFDLDCCCFGFDGQKVVSTPRGMRALRYGVNVLDSDREGPSYFKRAWKYQERGWRVAIPGFDEVKLNSSIINGTYYLLPKSEVLVNASAPELVGKEINILTSELVGQHLRPHECTLKCSFSQRCTVVRGIEYLLARSYGTVKSAVRNENLVAIPLLQDKNCLLLWSQPKDSEVDDDFSAAPFSAVDHFLEKNYAQSEGDDGWLGGGAIRKNTIVTQLRENVLLHMNTNTHLDFVYDFVRNYDELNYVVNAGRPPLTARDEAEFLTRYGIEKYLCFKRAARRTPVRNDWWSAAYG